MKTMAFGIVFFCIGIASADIATDVFQKRVDPLNAEEPHRYVHTAHLRTGLGRVTHFHYDAKKHDKLIAPHYSTGTTVIGCTQSTVTVQVDPKVFLSADSWLQTGHRFTTHNDHFSCPNPYDGSESKSPAYRAVTGVTSSDSTTVPGMKDYVLTTEPAAFADMFDTLSMRMHSTHMLHNDPSQIEAHAEEDRRLAEMINSDKTTKATQATTTELNTVRKLLSDRIGTEDESGTPPRRRLHWHRRRRRHHGILKKAAKWVKKKIIQPAEKIVKVLVTGKADKTWQKDFSINWNYDKVSGGALKSLPIAGQTACTSCYFHADAGYKVEIDIEHYHLQTILAEVYGDVKLNLQMQNPGPAVDVKKLMPKVFSSELFSVTFSIGPVPITVSLDLDVDVGLHFTVQEVGATPHINAVGEGHIRFGKQYTRDGGWKPVNTHTLDLNFDSAGGTVKADILLYANVVPKLTLHHIGSVSVIVTPALDVGLTFALPKANCDFKPLQEHSPVCQFSEGTEQNCALGLTVEPSINVELDMDLDIELFSKSIYKKTFDPMQLLQKTFAIKGFPKCLIGSWSKNRARRLHLLNVLSGVKQVSSRYLGDTDVGTGIRDPKLAESVAGPRLYLKQRGANTTCKNDCSGNGFCANATSSGYSCLCQEGWTGDDCTIPVIEVASIGALSGGVSTRAGGVHPAPMQCGHGVVLNAKTSAESQYLDVCRGRTDPFFCASGNETEMKLMDQTVRATLKSYAEGGYRCSSAMAELQCRLTFPAVHSMADKRILPVNYASCVKLFMPCLGTDEAEELCRGASSGGVSRGYAGIAAVESPWATTTMPTLYQAEHTAEEVHTKCTLAPSELKGCPERKGMQVHVNTDIFTDLAQMDQYVLDQVATMAQSNTSDCLESFRQVLCQSTMPLCNGFGNPIKMEWHDCVSLYTSCPDLGDAEPDAYGINPDHVTKSDSNMTLTYAKALCNDPTDFFTRTNVGKHPVTCGMEPTMTTLAAASKPPTPWHQDVGIVGPVCALAGLLIGVTMMAIVAVIKKNKREDAQAQPIDLSKLSTQPTNSTGEVYETDNTMEKQAELGHASQESMTGIAFPSNNKNEHVQSINPMETKRASYQRDQELQALSSSKA